jgi:hypothetical protein
MALAKAKARANKTFIAQSLLMIITYDRQHIFIVQVTDHSDAKSKKTILRKMTAFLHFTVHIKVLTLLLYFNFK